MGDQVAEVAARARRDLSGRVLAATLRSVRDLDIAEESTADAFLLALQAWPDSGVPASVEAWLITTARRRAVDRVRRAKVARQALVTVAGGWSGVVGPADQVADAALVGDDELRLVVLCCDPRISVTEQIALTLRLVCGVSTAGIAAAYGVVTPTMAARLTRAKAKLVRAGPMLDLPDDATVDGRLPVVARVVHLAFTLGHTRSDGAALMDDDLADRAQYLASVLHALRPADPSFLALFALIQLTRARAGGRLDDAGGQIVLPEVDRSRWDAATLRRGLALADAAWASGARTSLVVQSAIAAEHGRAPAFAATDWAAVVALYDVLLSVDPSPTLALNRCVALSYLRGPAQGLADLDELLTLPEVADGLATYPYLAAARAQLLARLGRTLESATQWRRAATAARTDAERDFFGARAAAPARER